MLNTTTGRFPVICKHLEEEEEGKKLKRKNIDGKNSSESNKRRKRKLNYLDNRISKLVHNALDRKRKRKDIDSSELELIKRRKLN
ncbi:hypothetical protein OROMI_020927 [Orobanche minor]